MRTLQTALSAIFAVAITCAAAVAGEPAPQAQTTPTDYARGLATGLAEGKSGTDWGCLAGTFFIPPGGLIGAYAFKPDGAQPDTLAALSAKEPSGYVSGYSEGFQSGRVWRRRVTMWGTLLGIAVGVAVSTSLGKH